MQYLKHFTASFLEMFISSGKILVHIFKYLKTNWNKYSTFSRFNERGVLDIIVQFQNSNTLKESMKNKQI